MNYSFLQNGDMALTVQFKNEISKEVNACVASLCHIMESKKIRGVVELIPTFTSVTVCYDCNIISCSKLKRKLTRLLKSVTEADASQKKRIFEIPVCYSGKYAEDIDNVSAHTGLSKEQIIKIHSSKDYLIYMLGFLPGFPYLGGMDESIFCPRLESPRTVIPAGSVGIGGEQTGIYPVESPGGWQLIGRTPVKVYDSEKEKPVFYNAGDYIRFIPIDENEFDEIKKQVDSGEYTVKVITEGI